MSPAAALHRLRAARAERARRLLLALIEEGRLAQHRAGCGYWDHVPSWGWQVVDDEYRAAERRGEEACTCEIRELRTWATTR
jgi:hypothetical protein